MSRKCADAKKSVLVLTVNDEFGASTKSPPQWYKLIERLYKNLPHIKDSSYWHTHTNTFHSNVWISRYLIHWKYHYQFILIVWTYFDVTKYFYPTFIFITFLKAYLQSLDSLNSSPIIKVNKKPWRRY